LKQLDALGPEERRRAARKRGVSWPTTDDARDRLQNTIHEVMRHEDDRIVDAPTALGKSYAIASTRWATLPDVTGERPVVHLLETRDARDEAIANAQEHGGTFHVLRGRHEACSVAAGDYDPDDDEDNDRAEISPYTYEGRGEPTDVSAHTLRHSVAWRMLRAEDGNTLCDVRNRLRHATIVTTERKYDHFDRIGCR
jgi:hypothetical protein